MLFLLLIQLQTRREGFSGKADSDNEFMFFLTFTVDVMPEETYETDVNRQLHSQIKEELQNMLIGKELNFEWEGEYDAEHDSDKDYNVSGQITSIGRNT